MPARGKVDKNEQKYQNLWFLNKVLDDCELCFGRKIREKQFGVIGTGPVVIEGKILPC